MKEKRVVQGKRTYCGTYCRSNHHRTPDRRRLCLDGIRADASFRGHGHHQYRTGSPGHPGRLPQLRAGAKPAHRPVCWIAHHNAVHVRPGRAIELLFIRPIRRDRTMFSILVTFGVTLIIEGVLNLIFSADYVQLHAWYITASFPVAGFYLSYIYVFGFLLAVVLLGVLYLLLYRTKFGHSLRATMQNRTAAELVGIDVERVSAITFGIGVALAAAGGMA